MPAGSARVAFCGVLAVLLTGCGGATSGPVLHDTAPNPSQSPATSSITVTYCSLGGVEETMDIYQPTGASSSPHPVVVYIHGGGWSEGSSALGSRAGLVARVTSGLRDAGFVVASINYRLAPQYQWPAQIQDSTCAVRYLRAQAATYNIDPQRIGAFGGSAGGHLVSMLGTAPVTAGYSVGPYLDQSSGVQAVADLWGPADLTASSWPPAATQAITTLFGTLPPRGSPALAKASPVTFVAQNDPPFLIVHGVQDATVPVSQSQELYTRLQAAGVPATLILVQNAGHGLRPVGAGPESPGQDEVVHTIVTFFTTTLAHPPI